MRVSSTAVLLALLVPSTSWAITLDQASNRLSPVLRIVDMPQPIDAGSTFLVRWHVMGYHGEPDSLVQFTCQDSSGATVQYTAVDESPVDLGEGWHWDDVYSRVYEFSTYMTLPRTLPAQDCGVRFYWRRGGAADFFGVYLSVLIPGGVDTLTDGDEGRRLLRTVRPSASGASSGSGDFGAPSVDIDSDDVSMEMAFRRLSPVLRHVSLPDYMNLGNTYTATWRVLGYHGDIDSLLQVTCDGSLVVSAEDVSPTVTPGEWHWGAAYSEEYEFSASFTIPWGSPLDENCEARFFWRRDGYDDYYGVYLSVLIPGGVDPRTLGTAGRQLTRTVVYDCYSFNAGAFTMPAFQGLSWPLARVCEYVAGEDCEHTYAVVRGRHINRWGRTTGGAELFADPLVMTECHGEDHEEFADCFATCDMGDYAAGLWSCDGAVSCDEYSEGATSFQSTNRAIINTGRTLAGFGIGGYGYSLARWGTYGRAISSVVDATLVSPNPVQRCYQECTASFPGSLNGGSF